jgi:AraC-like DNA-binding protein
MPISVFRGTDDAGNLHRIITELHRQLQSVLDVSENDILKNILLQQFMIELARQSTKKYHGNGGSKYVRKANAYLANHFDHDFKIQDIADEIGISVAYLQRLYKEQSGKTLVDKMNELRIEKAKVLLEASCLPITDIAINVGYNNRQHFTYTFTSLTGCSPAVYRKHRGNFRAWVN